MSDFKQKRDEYIKVLENKCFEIDNKRYQNDGITFSLTQFGLDCVYAEITKKEIQYHLENDEEQSYLAIKNKLLSFKISL